MPILKCPQNAGFTCLSDKHESKPIGVLNRQGDYKYHRFIGFIDNGSAKGILGKACRLEVQATH
jgi:hypothetical protein